MSYEIYNNEAVIITDVQNRIYESCVAAGWYTDLKTGKQIERNTGEVLMLMVTELAEAMEGYRKDLMDDHLPHRKMVEVELADCVIRIFDTCGAMGLDIGGAIQEKFHYNQDRADHKLENRQKPGGKQV